MKSFCVMHPSKCALVIVLAGVLGLAACHRAGGGMLDEGSASAQGRFAGVGIYLPGVAWGHLVAAEAPAPSAAKRVDDQAIIVVVDSHTGELRACGDLSGYCVGMNPWRTALVTAQMTPVAVTTHSSPGESPAAVPADTNDAAAASPTPR